MSMKNSKDTIGNWTRNRPGCSAVPQPCYRVPHIHTVYMYMLGHWGSKQIGVDVLQHYCNSNEFCAFVGLHVTAFYLLHPHCEQCSMRPVYHQVLTPQHLTKLYPPTNQPLQLAPFTTAKLNCFATSLYQSFPQYIGLYKGRAEG